VSDEKEMELEDYREALRAFDRAIELGMDNAYVWLYKAGCCAKLGRFEEAEECLMKAFELAPDLKYRF